MTGFDEFTMRLLTNKGILRMHRNSRNARQVFRRYSGGNEFVVWTASDCEEGSYIAIFNAGDETGQITFSMEELELNGQNIHATDLWSGENAEFRNSVSAEVPAHGVKVFYIAN